MTTNSKFLELVAENETLHKEVKQQDKMASRIKALIKEFHLLTTRVIKLELLVSGRVLQKGDFLTTKNLCMMFGVSRFTIRNWVLTGKLPHPIKLNRGKSNLRWIRSDVEQYIREGGIKYNVNASSKRV